MAKIRLTEQDLYHIIEESVKEILSEGKLNEFIAGGNDWGNTYDHYKRSIGGRTAVDDDIVRELHTICQYYDNDLPQELQKPIGELYNYMANRSNRRGDSQAMSVEEIKQYCLPYLQQLYKMDIDIRPVRNAVERLLRMLA